MGGNGGRGWWEGKIQGTRLHRARSDCSTDDLGLLRLRRLGLLAAAEEVRAAAGDQTSPLRLRGEGPFCAAAAQKGQVRQVRARGPGLRAAD